MYYPTRSVISTGNNYSRFYTINLSIESSILDLACVSGVSDFYAEQLGYGVTYLDYSDSAFKKS